MSINSFSQATNAYQSALKNAENLTKSSESSLTGSSAPTNASGANFADLIGGALSNARDSAYQAEAISTQGLLGKTDITDVVTAVAGAELALNTVVSIRDRVINSYQDIIKMPI